MLLDQFSQFRKGYSFGDKTFYNDFHVGVDYATPGGTPIYAHCNGYAKRVKSKTVGNAIYFTEPSGRLVRMLHLSSYEKTGDVQRGDLMGYTGNTGLSTGPHIHIDVNLSGRYQNKRSNFVDPELYFAPIHMTVVHHKGQHIMKRLKAVQDWYADHGISLVIHLATIDEMPQWEGEYIKKQWLAKHVVPHASGKDIVLFITDHWENERIAGYATNEKTLGVEVCCAWYTEKQDVKKRWFYNNDQLAATIRHEIMHTLYDMQGAKYNPSNDKRRNADNTHHYDYEAKDLAQCFKELRRDKMKGWNDMRMFKKAGWIKTKKKFTGTPKKNKIYRSTDSRMFFRYTNSWNIITETSYNHYAKQGAKRGIMSVQEANYIYDTQGMTPPEPKDYTIVDRIAKSQVDKLQLQLRGWKKDIPIWNY